MGADRLRAFALAAVVLAAVVLCAACAGATPETGGARVDSARDGDTILLDGGRRVRLVQIDAPELGRECHGDAAAAALARLAPPGTEVRLERDPGLDDVDRHGRLLRYVHAGGRNVTLELVRIGAAAPYFYRGERGLYARRLVAAAREAQTGRRGLWGACSGARLMPERQVETGPP